MSISKLLMLDFFKSQGFATKTEGMLFINENKRLEKKIIKKIDELDEIKYECIEGVKTLMEDFEEEKGHFMKRMKEERKEKDIKKQQKKRDQMKDEMRDEIMKELRDEEFMRKKEKLKNEYGNMFPNITGLHDLEILEQLFMNAIRHVDEEDTKEVNLLEKMKKNTEEALATLLKVRKVMSKYA